MMNSLFCPKCSSLQPMNTHISISDRALALDSDRALALDSDRALALDREIPGDEGSTKKVRTTNYHCAICFSFVRSIDEEIQPEEIKPDSESKVATQER